MSRRGLLLAPALALAGCAQPLLTIRQDGVETLIKPPQSWAQAPAIDPEDVDIKTSANGRQWLVFSRRTGRELFSISAAGGEPALNEPRAMAAIAQRVAPDTELGRQLARERVLNEKRAQVAPPSLSGPASDVDRPTYQLPDAPFDFAVVVGIERYADFPQAKFALRDAESVRAHLQALGLPRQNVAFLAGEKAEKAALEQQVERWLPRLAKRNGRVFFFFSGQSATDLKSGETYLLPWDADPSRLTKTGYAFRRLYRKLSALKSRDIIVAIDAGLTEVGDAYRAGLVVFSASAPRQQSPTLDEQGHGPFTYYFLRGLAGEAADAEGKIKARDLHVYLSSRFERGQSPRLWGPGTVVIR